PGYDIRTTLLYFFDPFLSSAADDHVIAEMGKAFCKSVSYTGGTTGDENSITSRFHVKECKCEPSHGDFRQLSWLILLHSAGNGLYMIRRGAAATTNKVQPS